VKTGSNLKESSKEEKKGGGCFADGDGDKHLLDYTA
jgi:hypothetical protein